MRISRAMMGVVAGAAIWGLSSAAALADTVTVLPGESMWSISQEDGIQLQSLQDANPSVNPNWILAGTQLKLPSWFEAYDTPGNLYWLGQVINAEAGGESLQTQIAVGDVIMHRIQSGQYGGNSVYDVVFGRENGVYQFSSVANGYIYHPANASSVQAAKDVLQDGTDEVPGALVFYNPSQTSAGNWVWSQPTVATIGNLTFAK
ncbi:cell wall hydrolase [Alicyclobacillus acidiphilus]|uniref:cell wall hydrolase n=1 Tax=Alicyclobacillus acidiphilus TaxID=182455 RepID=UPI000831BB1C|nr:cell wall hydrolase [Alicyclobacillus acidiphilus]